jgi:probable HAF family extracellular repeat protein
MKDELNRKGDVDAIVGDLATHQPETVMLKISLLPLTLALSLCSAGADAKVQQLPGFAANSKEGSIAVDINANGRVAAVIEDEDGKQRAVLYDKGVLELGTLGGSDSYTKGINDDGVVVGSAQDGKGHWRAFLVRKGERMRDLGTLGGGSSYGTAVNASGQAAGFADTADGYFRAFVLDAQGRMVDLGTLGGNISYASGINNHGAVVGTAALPDGYRRAFIHRPGAGMMDLGTLGGRSSAATGVNDAGVVVGASEMPNRRWHAFLHDGGKMVDLGALIGYGNSYATGINAAGHVVGTILIGDERRSFVYRDGKMAVHQAGKGLYLTNAINDEEIVAGATYLSKRYAAATMRSDMIPVVPKGHREFMGMMTMAVGAAVALMLLRRRYRGIALARY